MGLNRLSEFGICTVGNGSFKMRDLIKVGILGRIVVETQNKEDKLGRKYLTTKTMTNRLDQGVVDRLFAFG